MCITIIRNTIDDMVTNIDVRRSNDTMYSPTKDSNGNAARKSPINVCTGRHNAPAKQDIEHNVIDTFPIRTSRNSPRTIPTVTGARSTARYAIITVCSSRAIVIRTLPSGANGVSAQGRVSYFDNGRKRFQNIVLSTCSGDEGLHRGHTPPKWFSKTKDVHERADIQSMMRVSSMISEFAFLLMESIPFFALDFAV